MAKYVLFSGLALGIIIIGGVLFYFHGHVTIDERRNDPKDWVDDGPLNAKTINIEKMTNGEAYIDFNIPWNLNLNYNLVYSKFSRLPSMKVTQSLGFSGDPPHAGGWQTLFTALRHKLHPQANSQNRHVVVENALIQNRR